MIYIKNNSDNQNGIGFLGLLTIVFVVMKLLGVITWSWWYVTMPIWIIPGLVIAIFVFTFIVGCLLHLYEGRQAKKRANKRKTG